MAYLFQIFLRNRIRIDGDNWLMVKAWYHELVSKLKWSGGLFHLFSEKQGVRQGCIWSSTAYTNFNQASTGPVTPEWIGMHIGSIYCWTPTVADNICVASNCPSCCNLCWSARTLRSSRELYYQRNEVYSSC